MKMHGRTHPMCGGCWIEKESARFPETVEFDQIMRCCFCRRPTSSGIWYTAKMPPHCPDGEKDA